MNTDARNFTPALPFLWAYDMTVASVTRESVWRQALLQQLNPQPSDVIADLGCGTGSFLELVGKASPSTRLIGIDPDDRVLELARRKLTSANVRAELREGYLHDINTLLVGTGVNKIVSSLVFHHVSIADKRVGFSAMFSVLKPRGELHIADYGPQRTRLMRALFWLVQHVDGYETTQPNADGILPLLMLEAGFGAIEEPIAFSTPTGMISLYRAMGEPR